MSENFTVSSRRGVDLKTKTIHVSRGMRVKELLRMIEHEDLHIVLLKAAGNKISGMMDNMGIAYLLSHPEMLYEGCVVRTPLSHLFDSRREPRARFMRYYRDLLDRETAPLSRGRKRYNILAGPARRR